MRGAIALLLAADAGGGGYPTRSNDIMAAMLKLANSLLEVGRRVGGWLLRGWERLEGLATPLWLIVVDAPPTAPLLRRRTRRRWCWCIWRSSGVWSWTGACGNSERGGSTHTSLACQSRRLPGGGCMTFFPSGLRPQSRRRGRCIGHPLPPRAALSFPAACWMCAPRRARLRWCWR